LQAVRNRPTLLTAMRPSAALAVVAVLLPCLCGAGSVFAVESAGGGAARPPSFDPLPLLGMDAAAALDSFGPPREVFPVRGAGEGEDDVVFFYDSFMYLFWFQSRVWQVRFDRRFSGSVLGVAIGMSRAEVESACGGRLAAQDDCAYFDIPGCPCPARVRVVFEEGSASDIYVYRSDW
jgi:hypothetical protein